MGYIEPAEMVRASQSEGRFDKRALSLPLNVS